MYCRRCGKKLEDGATSCPACGTEVVEVKQRPYAEKYRAQRQAERAERQAEKARRGEARAAAASEAARDADALAEARTAAGIKADPYVLPATIVGAIALGLAMFPWPIEWGVGTSLPMKLGILALALFALAMCFLATRIEDENTRLAQAYGKKHKKRAFKYTRPKQLTIAQVLAGFSALMAVLSLFTS